MSKGRTMVDFHVGDEVVANRDLSAEREIRNSWRSHTEYFDVPEDTIGRVTSVRSTTRVRVQFSGFHYVGTVDADSLHFVDATLRAEREARRAEAQAQAMARAEAERLATSPKEGDIMPDDPRIAWLWKRIARYATNNGYCPQYDSICEEFGIPGRERSFGLRFKIGGMEMSTTVQATSFKDAQAKVVASLPSAEGIQFHNRETGRFDPYALAS
jgi:hypothetical protein